MDAGVVYVLFVHGHGGYQDAEFEWVYFFVRALEMEEEAV